MNYKGKRDVTQRDNMLEKIWESNEAKDKEKYLSAKDTQDWDEEKIRLRERKAIIGTKEGSGKGEVKKIVKRAHEVRMNIVTCNGVR